MSLLSPIHHTFGPLADGRQRLRALGMLFMPWKYRDGESTKTFTRDLSEAFDGQAFLFASGRGGLLALLRSLKIQPGDEVIVQAYTCVVVPNAIHAAGGKTIYADVDPETLNLDIDNVRKHITPRTRVIICQHTFGIPSDTVRLRQLCNEHHLVLIEDCAHVLPDALGPSAISHYGDFLLLAFGRDKAISGIAGGAIISRREDVSRALNLEWMQAQHLPLWTIARLLLYPCIYGIARPFYGLSIGKAFLKMMRILGLLIPILEDSEKQGQMPIVVQRIPNACAFLALDQWHRLREINDHRRALTRFYIEEGKKSMWLRPLPGVTPDLPLQKFPLFLDNAAKTRRALKRKNIYLDDGWTGCVICPPTVDSKNAQYRTGSDPKAEEVARSIVSLPTHPGMTRRMARRLIREIDRMKN